VPPTTHPVVEAAFRARAWPATTRAMAAERRPMDPSVRAAPEAAATLMVLVESSAWAGRVIREAPKLPLGWQAVATGADKPVPEVPSLLAAARSRLHRQWQVGRCWGQTAAVSVCLPVTALLPRSSKVFPSAQPTFRF